MEMQLFENDSFGKIRTLVEVDGMVLFCASDVAKALGYQRPQNAIRMHCRGYTLKEGIPHPQNPNKEIAMLFIPESDVYRLIFRSKLASAEAFERWVVEKVLPSIRRCGAYFTPEVLGKLEEHPMLASQLIPMLQKEQTKGDQLTAKIAEMEPKAAYFDKLVNTELLTNIRQTAKELHIPEKLFTYLLVDMGMAYRHKNKPLMPYAFMVLHGYAELKEYVRGKHGGVYMLFTPLGKVYLQKRIAQHLGTKDMEGNHHERDQSK